MPQFLDDFINKTIPDFFGKTLPDFFTVTIPDWWNEITENNTTGFRGTVTGLFDKLVDLMNGNKTYAYIILGAFVILVIMAIAVHKSNKREKKYYRELAEREKAELQGDIPVAAEAVSTDLPDEAGNSCEEKTVTDAPEEEAVQNAPLEACDETPCGMPAETAPATPAEIPAETAPETKNGTGSKDEKADALSYAAADIGAMMAIFDELAREEKSAAGEYKSLDTRDTREYDVIPFAQPEEHAEKNEAPIIMEKIELVSRENAGNQMKFNTSRQGKTFTEEELKNIIRD